MSRSFSSANGTQETFDEIELRILHYVFLCKRREIEDLANISQKLLHIANTIENERKKEHVQHSYCVVEEFVKHARHICYPEIREFKEKKPNLLPSVRQELERIILKLEEIERNERYQSAFQQPSNYLIVLYNFFPNAKSLHGKGIELHLLNDAKHTVDLIQDKLHETIKNNQMIRIIK